MVKTEKLIRRVLSNPRDLRYSEAAQFLSVLGYAEVKTGKSSGSRVRFMNAEGVSFCMHRPHPNDTVKRYVVRELIELYKEQEKG